MRKIFTTLCLIGLVALVSIPSFGQRTRRKSTQKAKVVFNYGTVDGQIYTNDFFGLKFTVPEDLTIRDRETEDLIINYGKKESEKIHILLIAESPEYGGFWCYFSKLSPFLKNLTAKQFLQSFIAYERNSATRLSKVISSKVEQEKLGSNMLSFIDLEYPNGSKQRLYITKKKSYFIKFILTYSKKSELETMNSILAGADLNWKKS